MPTQSGLLCSHSITIADYQPPFNLFPTINLLYNGVKVDTTQLSEQAETILCICALYYCRISEVLNLTLECVLTCDRVLIKAAKGSRSYIIWLPGIVEHYGPSLVESPTWKVFNLSYSAVYAQAIKAGLRSSVEQRDNAAVTHLARYRLVSELSSRIKLSQISDVMRHKYTGSTRHYMPAAGHV